jgi:hypothetical protein
MTRASFARTHRAIAALLILVLIPMSAALSVELLGIEPIEVPGSFYTQVHGINNSRVLTGSFYNPLRGFLRDAKGNYSTLPVVGSGFYDVDAFGLNDHGDIVGAIYDRGELHGYKLDSAGNLTIIDVPDGFGTQAQDINNSGTIVGFFESPTGVHGFMRDKTGGYTILDPPGVAGGGFTGTFAYGINDDGEIVGSFDHIDGVRGFLRDTTGNYTILDVPGQNVTEALGINNLGEIVGFFYDQWGGISSGVHGFLRARAGNYTTLDVPGVPDTRLFDINDDGTIVGWYENGSGLTHSFLAELNGEIRPAEVAISIKPRRYFNRIDLHRHKLVRVAILSNDDFDAPSQVDQSSLTFGATGHEQSFASCSRRPSYVNQDDLKEDLVCQFYVDYTGFQCGDTLGFLRGVT